MIDKRLEDPRSCKKDAADNMVKRYGIEAYSESIIRAEELKNFGDDEAYQLWTDIAKIILSKAN